MDEIEISLGTEPAPITTEDLDTDPRTRGLNPSMPAGQERDALTRATTLLGTKVHPAQVSAPAQRAEQTTRMTDEPPDGPAENRLTRGVVLLSEAASRDPHLRCRHPGHGHPLRRTP